MVVVPDLLYIKVIMCNVLKTQGRGTALNQDSSVPICQADYLRNVYKLTYGIYNNLEIQQFAYLLLYQSCVI